MRKLGLLNPLWRLRQLRRSLRPLRTFRLGISFFSNGFYFFPFFKKINKLIWFFDLLEVSMVMKTCLGILSEPRENGFVNRDMLFYMLNELSPEYFSSQSQVNRTIQGLFSEFSLLILRRYFC